MRVPIALLGHVTARGSSSDGKDVPSVLVSIKPSYQVRAHFFFLS